MANIYLQKAFQLCLEKAAEYDLQPHQERVAKRIEEGDSLLAAHSLGSGKTLTALESAMRVQKRDKDGHVVVIVPAPLVSNMEKEIDKHGIDIDKDRFHVMSYEMAMKKGEDLGQKNISLLIMDEAHKGRNVTAEKTRFTRWLAHKSKQTLMLTGTPSYNKASDVAVLANTLAKKKVLPELPKDFESAFTYTTMESPGFFQEAFLNKDPIETTRMRNQHVLQNVLGKYIDFHDAKSTNPEDFPVKVDTTHEVEMSPEQMKVYRYLEGELPMHLRRKIRAGMPLSKQDQQALNSFSTGIRQSSNTLDPYLQTDKEKDEKVTPKLKTMVERLEHHSKNMPNFKAVMYSNYLDAGLKPLSRELKKKGIEHEIFDGSVSEKKRQDMVKRYNEDKLKVLLVSSSGTEGLDLKGTKLVQVMEPHFNEEKINQVIGRAIRYKSHAHLPEKERKVLVERYHSVFPKKVVEGKLQEHKEGLNSVFGIKAPEGEHSIDQYLTNMAKGKKEFSEEIMDEARKGFQNQYLEKAAQLLEKLADENGNQVLTKEQVQVLVGRRPVESYLRGALPIAGAAYAMPVVYAGINYLAAKRFHTRPLPADAGKFRRMSRKILTRNLDPEDAAKNLKASLKAKTYLPGIGEIWNPGSLVYGGVGFGLAGPLNYYMNKLEADKRDRALSALGVDSKTGDNKNISTSLKEKTIQRRLKELESSREPIKGHLMKWIPQVISPPSLAYEAGLTYAFHKRNQQVDTALANLKSNIYMRQAQRSQEGPGKEKSWNNFDLSDESFYK